MLNAKLKSFILLGATTVLTAYPLVSHAHDYHEAKTKLDAVISDYKSMGLLSDDFIIKPEKLKDGEEKYLQFWAGRRIDKQCEIVLGIDEKGNNFVDLSMKPSVSITKPNTNDEIRLSNKFTLLHEASHCEFSGIEQPILVRNNKQLQKDMNYLFKFNEASSERLQINNESKLINHDGLYSIINENFADAYAAIQLLKSEGINKNTLSALHKIETQRHIRGLEVAHIDGLSSHTTHFSLQSVLSPSNLEKIATTNNVEELKNLALVIANEGAIKVLLSKNPEKAFDSEHITNSIFLTINRLLGQDKFTKENNLSIVTNVDEKATSENSVVYAIANQLVEKIKQDNIPEEDILKTVVWEAPPLIEKAESMRKEITQKYLHYISDLNLKDKLPVQLDTPTNEVEKHYTAVYIQLENKLANLNSFSINKQVVLLHMKEKQLSQLNKVAANKF